jgi:biotin transport system substrate-specific component
MYPSLAVAVIPRIEESIWVKIILAIVGSVLLAVSAKVQIPFWPVPMTMQTFMILVLGMVYGPRLGVATLGLYLSEGAVGLPVFATGSGIDYMIGPTGGYLAGFVLAIFVTGHLAGRGWDRNIVKTLVAMLAGTLLIFTPGILWLSTFIGFENALAAGLTPFLLSESLKIALAVLIMPLIWKRISN